MNYIYVMDRIKDISTSCGGLEEGLEELVRRYDIIEKQNEDAMNGEFLTPEGFVLVDKYDLDELVGMAWGHCKDCRVHECSRTVEECLKNNMLCHLWEARCKAFGMEEGT